MMKEIVFLLSNRSTGKIKIRQFAEHSYSRLFFHQESLNLGDLSYYQCDYGHNTFWASFIIHNNNTNTCYTSHIGFSGEMLCIKMKSF